MNYILTGVGGALVGGIIGWILGKRTAKKKYERKNAVETIEINPENDEIGDDLEEFEDENDYEEYETIMNDEGYTVEGVLDEVDDYLAERESPSEDEEEDETPLYSANRGYFVDQDEYYTAKPGYEKYVLEYDSTTESLFDKATGDDMTKDLTNSGFSIPEMLRKFGEDDRVYWRIDGYTTDYEIMFGED